jgi:hypothetical protein
MVIKILVIKFLGVTKVVLVATRFMTTKTGQISIACKPTVVSLKWSLTSVDQNSPYIDVTQDCVYI